MTDAPRPTAVKRIERAERDERLARALRDNLRRRKEQARAQQRSPANISPSAEPPAGAQVGGKPPA